MPETKGKLIVFEGIDGCGKTTQLTMYANHLRALNKWRSVACRSREPWGYVGDLIREVLTGKYPMLNSPEELARLFAASRWEHAKDVLRPAMESGLAVLCDRYLPSSYVYQGEGEGPESDRIAYIRRLNADIPMPTITLVFDIAAETALGRIAERNEEKSVFDADKIDRVRKRALTYDMIGKYPGVGHVVHILGAGTVEEVHAAVRAVLDPIVLGTEGHG